jgi:site-specific DNA-methyltransferase (adenine-specific)
MNSRASDSKLDQLLIGDAKSGLKKLAPGSVDMILTSPPYFLLRDYGHESQLGLEQHVDQWVSNLVDVAGELHRVLADHGTLWLNVGDTYSMKLSQGAKKKSLLMAPERLALALIEQGWILRNKIVWAKPNGLPSSAKDRLTSRWEAIYVLTKKPHYFFDLDALRVPHISRPPSRRAEGHRQAAHVTPKWLGPNGNRDSGIVAMKAEGRVGHELGKNPGDIWTIATSNWRGDHHAVFPLKLAERAIIGGCPEATCHICRTPYVRPIVRKLGAAAMRGALGKQCACASSKPEPGIVLDPFMGAGTTAIAAENLHRGWVGVELNPDYAAIATARITDARRIRKQQVSTPKGGTE